tara:strand:- start:2922 stop:3386 length:465 start_codon:yes stop_codon:yes gene_type:complete
MNKITEPVFAFGVVVLFVVYALIANAVQGANMTDLILALEKVESNGNEIAYNESEKALGCLQIRPIMLADYNRIYSTSFTHDQMKSRSTSHLVAIGIFHHYGKYIERSGEEPNAKHLAFIWNGGGSAWKRVSNPKDDQKQNNLETYWKKVSKNL